MRKILLLMLPIVLLGLCAGCSSGSTNSTDNTSAPVIDTFTATPETIDSGQISTLSWTTRNATSCTLNGMPVPDHWITTVTPETTTTYTLRATGPGGTASRSITVTVVEPINAWTLPILHFVINEPYLDGIRIATGMAETDTSFTVAVATNNEVQSIFATIQKTDGQISQTVFQDYFIQAFELDPDQDFVSIARTGSWSEPVGTLTTFSTSGTVVRETRIPEIFMGDAFVRTESGVVFSYAQEDIKGVIAKYDWTGSAEWERHFTDELDPGLTGNEHVVTGAVVAIKQDVDGNLVVLQNITKSNAVETADSGYAVYQVNPEGELLWTTPHYRARRDWGESAGASQLVLFPDGTMVVNAYICGPDPGCGNSLVYLDNRGSYVRDVHQFPHGQGGRITGSDDSAVVIATRVRPVGSTYRSDFHWYKLDLNGNPVWDFTWSFSDSEDLELAVDVHSITRCEDFGFLISATYSTDDGEPNRRYGVVFLWLKNNGQLLNRPTLSD